MKNRNLTHSDNWKTPKWFYDELDREFHFDFDPCPYSESLPLFDGLSCEWGNCSFVNPPYSRKLKEAFIKKGIEQSKKGKTVVMLLPVSTSTKIFHEWIIPNKKEIRFIKGRIKFEGINQTNGHGMHDSMVVIFQGSSSKV